MSYLTKSKPNNGKAGSYLLPISVISGAFVLHLWIALPLLLTYPLPQPDEALWGDAAHHLSQPDGNLKLPLWAGAFKGAEDHFYFQPPAYFVGLAITYRIFGFGLLIGRGFSLVCSLLLSLLISLAAANARRSRPLAIVAALTFAMHPLVIRMGHLVRMESLCLFLQAIAIAIVVYAVVKERLNLRIIIVVGILTGLAGLTHFAAVTSFLAITSAILLASPQGERRRLVLAFIIPNVALFGLWMLWMLRDTGVAAEQLFAQYMAKRTISAVSGDMQDLLIRYIGQYPSFWPLWLIWLPLTMILSVAAAFQTNGRRAVYVLAAVGLPIASVLNVFSGVPWYAVYPLAWSVFGVGALLVLEESNKWLRKVAMALAGLFVILTLHGVYWIYTTTQALEPYVEFAAAVEEFLPAGSKVYLATEPDLYYSLVGSEKGFVLRSFFPIQMPPTSVEDYLAELETVDFIVIGGQNMDFHYYLIQEAQDFVYRNRRVGHRIDVEPFGATIWQLRRR